MKRDPVMDARMALESVPKLDIEAVFEQRWTDIAERCLAIAGEHEAIRNLLARIHRDGGHHTEEVGLLQSIEDAETKVVHWLGFIHEFEACCQQQRKETT